jgi:transcriptional regulator GlxA family with amidase domain
VGILGFEGVAGLDLIGPIEAFSAAWAAESSSSRCYDVRIIGVTSGSFTSESGITFKPHLTLQTAGPLDTIIVPGGNGLRAPEVSAKVCSWLKAREASTRRVVSVCTGIYALASAGLLDGRRVTTHWRFTYDVAKRFPKLKVDSNALYVKDGKFYTSAGVTTGIDLSLALIEEDFGADVALAVARELVVYFRRPGGQEQYSQPLRLQAESSERFAGLVSWVRGRLQDDLSVGTLAAHSSLSRRHFTRLFKQEFGKTPAEFVDELRLDEARMLLASPHASIEAVGAAVGFCSPDAFRRAFTRRFGVLPSLYKFPFDTSARCNQTG